MSNDELDDEIEDGDELEDPPAAAAHPQLRAPRPGKGKRTSRTPVGGASFQKESNEADFVWNELVEWLPSQHLSPQDVAITVKRIAPPSPTGGSLPMGRSFGGEAVAGGGGPPGDALTQYVLRYYHLASGDQRPATYDIYFTRKATGGKLSVGRLNLPSAAECRNLLTADEQAAMGQSVGAAAPVQPPRPWPQPQPIPAYFGAPSAAPPVAAQPPQQQGLSSEMQLMLVQEIINAARENRQPVMPQQPPPPVQAQPQVGLSDHDVQRIAMQLAGIMGAGQPAQPPVATQVVQTATPPVALAASVPVDASIDGMVRRSVNGMLETLVKTALGSVEKTVKQSMGMGAPSEVAEVAESASEIVADDPADAVPWRVSDVGSTWADGRPMKVALDKESKSIDLMGTMMANPLFAEKAMDLANGLGEALKQLIQSRTPTIAGVARPPPPPPQTQVVQRIPPGAVDANPGPNGAVAPTGWEAP